MSEASGGLVASLKQLLSTLIGIVSTRLALLENEWQEERAYLTQMFVMGLFALFSLGMGVLLLSVFIVVLFWDEHRLAALGLMSAFFFVTAAGSALWLRNKARHKSGLFSASLAEFARDREQLEAGHE